MEVEEYFSFSEGDINPRDKQDYPFRKRNDDLYNDILKFYQSEQTYIPEALQQSGQAFRNKRSRFRSNCIDNYYYDTKLDRILAYEEVSSHYLSKTCPKSPVLTDKGLYLTCYYIPLASEKKIILAQAHNKFMHNGRDKMLIMIEGLDLLGGI